VLVYKNIILKKRDKEKGDFMVKKKVTIVGAGHVGATAAQLIAEKDMANVVIIDVAEGITKGKALDIEEACPLWGSSSEVIGSSSYDDTANSDIVVITAGLARKPGMSRDDLLEANAQIVSSVAEKIRDTSPHALIIVVTNPMDAMAYLTFKVTGFAKEHIIGMGGILDTARFKSFIARELKVSPEIISTMVLGGHGDTMVPMPRLTTISGIPLTLLMSNDKYEALIERTRKGGAEIVGYLKTGSAFYAPAASVVEIIDTIFRNKNKILPCSVYLEGEYGIHNVFTGVPVKISARGIEEIIELELTDDEKAALKQSAQAVEELIGKLRI
jgi:malate dehydrogenase